MGEGSLTHPPFCHPYMDRNLHVKLMNEIVGFMFKNGLRFAFENTKYSDWVYK